MKKPQNKQTQAKQFNIDDFNKVPVKLNDIDLQFLRDTKVREQRIVQNVVMQFAEQVQHFVALTAKKKNIQFNEALFAGVFVDEKKKTAYVLQHKKPPQPQKAEQPASK